MRYEHKGRPHKVFFAGKWRLIYYEKITKTFIIVNGQQVYLDYL